MNLLIPLFSPATGTWGGITRSVAMVEAARKAGHQVAFCSSGSMAEGLKKHGYTVYPTPPATMFGLPAPISRILEGRSQRASIPVQDGKSIGSIWLVVYFSGLGSTRYMRALVEAQRAAAHDFKADAIYTDIDPAAFLTAAIELLPMNASYTAVAHEGIGSWAWKRMNAIIAPILKEHNLPEQSIDQLFFSPSVLKIIPSIPELDGADSSRPDVRYVGHLLGPVQPTGTGRGEPEAFQPEPGRRYVFVYLGTGSLSLDVLRRVLPRVFPADGPLRWLVGAQSIQSCEQIGGVHFQHYVPADAVLPFCNWVISHGGQNTIAQSLLHGVPMILFPGPIFERRFNAQKVQQAGAGWMAERHQFTQDHLESLMKTQESCAVRANQLSARIQSYGGADEAIEAITQFANTAAN